MKCSAETEPEKGKLKLNNYALGIDVGIKSLAVVSCNGRKRVFRNINRNHKVRRLDRQLRHLQRKFSRKEKDSRNRRKIQWKMKKIYSRLANIRRNYIHQAASAIIKMKASVIVLEDLNIQAMLKNRYLARAVKEQYLYMFRCCIERKAVKAGIKVVYADRFYPSSKQCSVCGHKKEKLKLSERIYRCGVCGAVLDGDFNAARNLEKLAE